MIALVARLLEGLGHVAVGARSPIPAAGALLARQRGGGRPRVSILGSENHNPFTDGGVELFDCAAQGRIDAFFLSGAQIDGAGNVNLLGIGDKVRPRRRFAGNFGAPYLAHLVPHLILMAPEHSRRSLVERVDFISALGSGPEGVTRPGGPRWLVTERCLFRFEEGRFRLASLHPGETLDGIREATGFAFDAAAQTPTTAAPDPVDKDLVAGPIRDQLEEIYPRFARTL